MKYRVDYNIEAEEVTHTGAYLTGDIEDARVFVKRMKEEYGRSIHFEIKEVSD